jgi:hypothetical protein
MAEKGVMVVRSNCANPAREEEFRRWYTETHLPDLLDTPGIVRARFFENIDPSSGAARYLAIYEIEGDPEAVVAERKVRSPALRAQGRVIDCIQAVTNETWRLIGEK